MFLKHARLFGLIGVIATVLSFGCATEQARVNFSYVVEPSRGLPEGMTTIAIQPAKVGPATDSKWSELCANTLQSLVNESRLQFGTDVTVTDRRDTQVTFDEADLAAAGMSTRRGGEGGRLLAADGVILANINVKVEKHIGLQRTITGFDIAAFRGRHFRGGRAAVETGEVETVSRNLTVQTDFRLIDPRGGNKVWEQATGNYRSSDRTGSSWLFGSSSTEAELTPRDQIIGELVERGAREFVSRLMPCKVPVSVVVESSTNKNCIQGVKLLRAEAFAEAVSCFQLARSENPGDHQAAFGAGVACEASGRYDEALVFYRQACLVEQNSDYAEARDRMKAYAGLIRR